MTQYRPNPLRSPMNWTLTNKHTWTSYKGCKIVIFDDVVICVSNLESRIMQITALGQLKRYHDICIRNCRRDPLMSMHCLRPSMYRYLSSVVTRATFNIFGLGLEATTSLELSRFNHRRPCANNQYTLHVPRFVVESVKFIEKYGVTRSGIFLRGGSYFRPFEVAYQIMLGDEHNVSINTDVLEVATVLKHYLENMPEGLFTAALEYQFVKAIGFDVQNRVKVLSLLVQVLPRANRETLYLLVALLHKITHTRGNGMEGRQLNEIFCPILFRYKGIVENNCMGVIQALIQCYPVVFTLKATQLDLIYKHMADRYPRKLDDHLYRRSHQCHRQVSDIPPALWILSKQMRSYNACETDSYHHLERSPPSSMIAHLLETRSFHPATNVSPDEAADEASEDNNQFPGFEMVEVETPSPSGSSVSLNDWSSDYRVRINVLGPVAEVEEEKYVTVVEVLDGLEPAKSVETAQATGEAASAPEYKDVSVVEVFDKVEEDGNYLTCKPGKAPVEPSAKDEDAYESFDPGMVIQSINKPPDDDSADTGVEEAAGTSNVHTTLVRIRPDD